jgi:hypothetical protein
MVLYDLPRSFFWHKVFIIPLIWEIFILVSFVIGVILVVKRVKKEKITKANAPGYVIYVLGVVISVFFIYSFAQYFKFGVYMPFEGEETISLEGQVEEIHSIRQLIRFGYRDDGSIKRAYEIKINGVSYLCIEADLLSVGDTVTVKCFRKSKIITYCKLMKYE